MERGTVVEQLREKFPYGHPEFLPITVGEAELHSNKNHDYAKGGTPLGNFDRVAAILSLYPGLDPGDRRVVALTYALKQLDAVLWGLAKKIQHRVEGLSERLQDISVYAKIVMCMIRDDSKVAEMPHPPTREELEDIFRPDESGTGQATPLERPGFEGWTRRR